MSLSSFLLTSDAKKDKGKAIDKGLDDLFRSTAAAPTPSTQPSTSSSATVAAKKLAPESFLSKPDKKRKLHGQETSPAKAKKSRKEARAALESDAEESKLVPQKKPKSGSSKAKQPPVEAESSNSHSEDEDKPHEEEAVEAPDDSGSDDEGDPSKLVHESVASGGKTKSASGKVKFVPSEETAEQRDARTVFVGNVPVEVVKSRPLRKQFERHILSFVPSAKIESLRFRSVAFQKPTTQLPTDDPSSSKAPQKPREKDGRQHDRERAATWRASKGQDDDETAAAASGKTFLTPQEKKRIAFIKQEIHSGVDSVNAYVVFAHPVPVENRPKNLPPPKPVMDPYEAAKTVIKTADGSVFMERTIRVDFARKDKTKSLDVADAEMAGDPKATIFVGNLDFASKEEDVRAFFEGLVVAERGQPPESSIESGDAAAVNKRPAWVKRVRVIRDKDTLLGKGFCYVQFVDRECVDEVLALEEDRLKFAKRKLRVQRCKTLPGAPKLKFAGQRSSGVPQQKSRSDGPARSQTKSAVPISVPKGDPSLGTKIAGLSKEERKKVKSTDADRVARRLAKKKAKALAEKGVKAKETVRERVRKRPQDKKGTTPEKGKKRVRSNKALSKMNTKK